MAGVKGMKGGGGARNGAGRKPKPATVVTAPPTTQPAENSGREESTKDSPRSPAVFEGVDDPLVFLRMAWKGEIAASPTQVRAAASALPFVHTRLGEGGKKEARNDAAKKVAGRFSASSPPKLVAAGGKSV